MSTQFRPEVLTRIGRYTVVRFLAEGGMSWVFEVTDSDLFDVRRALKLIKPHVLVEGEMLERFEDEVRLLALIEHPNLVRVYDYSTDAATGARFFTMEFIEGPHLGEVAAEWLIEPGRTTAGVTIGSLSEIGDFFLGILSALARVHGQGVFHRDIKPENIVVTHDGIAKLIDFSIARDTNKAGVTRHNLALGTPEYMSPEQARGEPVGPTSDLCSLGLTLYRVLTGQSIYAVELGDDRKTQQIIRHLWSAHAERREFNFAYPTEVPAAVIGVIRRACRIDPNGRYQSAREMREALSRALQLPYTTADARPPRSSRRGLLVGAAGVALFVGLLTVYVSRPQSRGEPPGIGGAEAWSLGQGRAPSEPPAGRRAEGSSPAEVPEVSASQAPLAVAELPRQPSGATTGGAKAEPQESAASKRVVPDVRQSKEAKPQVDKPAEAKPVATKAARAGSAPIETPQPISEREPAPVAISRLEVEEFLLDWETAIASKDFALYSRLGLPGNEESFRRHYVENEARIDFSLRDFGQTDPDELVVRVQMVLETQDAMGTRHVDEERRFVVKQTPAGLRYIGIPKH